MAQSKEQTAAALLDRAILETMGAREAVFAIGDDALIELVDALVLGLGRVAAKYRDAAILGAELPRAA